MDAILSTGAESTTCDGLPSEPSTALVLPSTADVDVLPPAYQLPSPAPMPELPGYSLDDDVFTLAIPSSPASSEECDGPRTPPPSFSDNTGVLNLPDDWEQLFTLHEGEAFLRCPPPPYVFASLEPRHSTDHIYAGLKQPDRVACETQVAQAKLVRSETAEEANYELTGFRSPSQGL